MRHLGFFGKELKEIYKTSKIIVLPVIFLFFGLMSPLTARYVNELLKNFADVPIQLPEPTYMDSYYQLFKNLNTICIIVMVLALAGTVVGEKVKGSAVLVLTKRVSRAEFILSKFFAAVLLFTVSYILSAAAAIYYTYILFPKFYSDNLMLAFTLFWIYGVVIIAATVFASTACKSYALAAVTGFVGYILVSVLGALPKIGKYTPGIFTGMPVKLLNGELTPGDGVIPAVVSLAAIIVLIAGSIIVFTKQEL